MSYDPTNANDRFEWLAAAFYRDTGLMAPGKDCPAALGMDNHAERMSRWVSWNAANRAVILAALPPRGTEG